MQRGSHPRSGRLTALAAAVLAATALVTGPAVAGASRPSPATASLSSQFTAADNWAGFHQGPLLDGWAQNSSLSDSTAYKLGVHWATDLYGAALDSPVVAYNPTLKKMVAYVGTEAGNVLAIDVSSGRIIWGASLGSPIRSTPVVYLGSVYLGTFDSPRIYRLDATTGAVICSAIAPMPIEGTPVAATPKGGKPTIYIGTNDSQSTQGPLVAMNAQSCALEWQFSGYTKAGGVWVAASYAVDARGTPLVLFGTADPDSAAYALNAVTGALVWRFAVANPAPGVYDIGAGMTISAPGNNGFADGVAYVPTKYGIMYALNLTTGKQIWSYNFNKVAGATEGGRSTAALCKNNLVFGYNGGLFDIDAVKGTLIWRYKDPSGTEALSSPAIAGAGGKELVVVGDVSGAVDVVSLSTGKQLYQLQTNSYITASPAITAGDVLIASTDGHLYDLVVGGGADVTLPATKIKSPADNSTIANPGGDLLLQGTATDPRAVSGVEVAVQSGGPDGPWWDAATKSWSPGPVDNPATLGSSGSTSTSWKLAYPVPTGGGTYAVTAYAVSSSGQSDLHGAADDFTVLYSTSGPHVLAHPTFVAPGAVVSVQGGGFQSGEKVSISLDGTVLGTGTASATGYLARVSIQVPRKAKFGPAALKAKGATSGSSAATTIVVSNDWYQFGQNSARTGLEANDPVFYNLIHPGTGLFVDEAWHYVAPGPLASSPAIVDGTAYLGDTKGDLLAVDVHNGSLLWTWTLPSKQPLVGSPAVDPLTGLVIVGARDGTIAAISTAAGKQVWSKKLPGSVFDPALYQGLVFVTSADGTVRELAEATGSLKWKVSLAAKPNAPAAYDPSNNLLVVGEDDGAIVGLTATTGAQRWSYKTGGPINAAPDISGGSAYAGSSDGSVYALAESNGKKLWSYKIGSAVADTGVVTDELTATGTPALLIGADNGKLYALVASSGKLSFKVDMGGPVKGCGSAKGVVICDTSKGTIGASRSYTFLKLWSFKANGAFVGAPALVNGAIYVAGTNGSLYAFTPYGQPPV